MIAGNPPLAGSANDPVLSGRGRFGFLLAERC